MRLSNADSVNDFALEEPYTDTHDYTEINFAAFMMIGMRFCCASAACTTSVSIVPTRS